MIRVRISSMRPRLNGTAANSDDAGPWHETPPGQSSQCLRYFIHSHSGTTGLSLNTMTAAGR